MRRFVWDLTIKNIDDNAELDDEDREELARLILEGCTSGRLDKDTSDECLPIQPVPVWEREGEPVKDSGEISGLEAQNPDDKMVGDDWTSYYKRGNDRASFCYYVVETLTRNQPKHEKAWIVEYVFHFWKVDNEGELIDGPEEQYQYESASPLFYNSLEKAQEVCKSCADKDESEVLT